MVFLLYLIYAILIVGPIYLVFLWFKIAENKRKEEWLSLLEYETILIEVPRNNEKSPLAAEQMFASLHGIYNDSAPYQYHISFEIISIDKFVQFYVHVPKHLVDFVEGQIYAQYPTIEINRIEDYAKATKLDGRFVAGCELKTTRDEVYPIKMFSDFEVDPLSGITSVMSKINPGEDIWLQIMIRPVGDDWQEKGINHISNTKKGYSEKKISISNFPKVITAKFVEFGGNFLKVLIDAGKEVELADASEGGEIKLSGPVEEALKSVEFKIMKLGFQTKIRIISVANDPASARVKVQGLAAAFKQFNTTNANGFKSSEILINNKSFIDSYIARDFFDDGYILNISELASIYHLPHQTVETPHIVWAGSKKGEPPANLPLAENIDAKQITVLGETNFRNVYRKFGIKLDDRRRHCYIIGKSGTGKSTLIENMAIDDVVEGRGVVIVDPHGELADKVLTCIPDDRVNDVIVFDPADRSFPIALNLLDKVDDDFKGMVASGFVGIFKKIFGDSWGPRLEHILRNTVLALLDYPESTMLDIPRMLTEKRFREKVVSVVIDPVIRDFWTNEFAQYDSKFRTEAVSPILNKVGQFLSTATIRNIVGQPHSRIDIREIMDSEKILIINLSRGKIGEDNSALLGAMMITKIQLSAMSRADVTVDQRPDSYLYVDEFQNFATESFSVILSEARKYNLNLTIANQYITQMPEIVRDAVFGNAGTIISFRVGGTDADFLVKEFEPVFDANDLVNLDRYQIYTKLLIDGITKPAFSARTLPPVQKISGNRDRIIDHSRTKYSQDRSTVENMIIEKSRELEEELRSESGSFFNTRKNNQSDSSVVSYGAVAAKQGENRSRENRSDVKESQAPVVDKPKVSEIKSKEERLEINNRARTEKEKKPRILRWQNIIRNKIYKEQTARGGIKWYVGDEIDKKTLEEQGITIDEKGREMIGIMDKIYSHKNKVGEKSKKNTDDEKPKSDNKNGDDKNDENKTKNEERLEKSERSKKLFNNGKTRVANYNEGEDGNLLFEGVSVDLS
jgi:hypothetical protein